MSERTPKTNTIRIGWAQGHPFPLTTDVNERYAEFDRWLAAHDAEAAEELARAKRGAKTLGEIVERQIEDTLRWAGMEDQIGTDDPDQQLAWELCAEMPGRITELEAQVAALREERAS